MRPVVDRTTGKRSPKWALFSVTRIYQRWRLYLFRLRVFETPLCALYLHVIWLPDEDRDPHDHPRPFLSLVLRGGYDEWTPDGVRSVRWLSTKRPRQPHRILRLHREPTVTLLFLGPRGREWGFHTEDGWVRWDEYLGVSR